MLLFLLDVKFQVYEKICTKLLLINFNMFIVVHCLGEPVSFLLTLHDKKDFDCAWPLK